MAEKTERRIITTTVTHTARPLGPARENGPHLGDLREFVEGCRGMPDDLVVFITNGTLSESGRRDVTFRVEMREPIAVEVQR